MCHVLEFMTWHALKAGHKTSGQPGRKHAADNSPHCTFVNSKDPLAFCCYNVDESSNVPMREWRGHNLTTEICFPGAGVPEDAVGQDSEVWPVYRASPYRAEAARQAQASTTTHILFVDEGHQCR